MKKHRPAPIKSPTYGISSEGTVLHSTSHNYRQFAGGLVSDLCGLPLGLPEASVLLCVFRALVNANQWRSKAVQWQQGKLCYPQRVFLALSLLMLSYGPSVSHLLS